ncbi:hypothetical protein DVH24_003985 [Malus domestica]|uniref:Beta-amylase n=1 Tax=Malus domestica TaxID=3750 RepID=A0A498KCT2_MALDO|nr:hypothetical protein DVH24_003985 [Malus domestica]
MPVDAFCIDGMGHPWIRKLGLKLHVALSFHSNVNSSSSRKGGVTLPLWIIETALQCYEDFMSSFAKKFEFLIGTVIEEISVGLGPSGELKMGDLKMAARKEGKPQWEEKGPQKAGCYNSLPSEVPFFGEGEESFLLIMGVLSFGSLLHHADDILAKAANILKKYQENEQTSIILAAKIGGIYWWYQAIAHPAELTAGYYNTVVRNGYDPVASLLSRHGAALHVPMNDLIGLVYGKYMLTVTIPRPKQMNCKIFTAENWSNFVPFVKKMSTNW